MVDEAEQILEAACGLEERIALHVEEDVALRRRGQQTEAGALVDAAAARSDARRVRR